RARSNKEPVMNISFENQVALVTGAASGLGLATAKAFAQSGASVVLADTNEKAVHSAAEELSAQGHKTLAIKCDVADDAQVEAMVDRAVATFGRWSRGRRYAANIPGLQARGAWADQERGAGLCRKGHPHQCGLSGHHPYLDARQDDGNPSRRPQRDVERRADRSAWPPRGDRE